MRRKHLWYAVSFCLTLVYWRSFREPTWRKHYQQIYLKHASDAIPEQFRITESPSEVFQDVSENWSNCFGSKLDRPNSLTPRYRLNPHRLLIPNLNNGPNNQIIGFQQSALIAILLNRTLVLPPFYYHTTDPKIPKKIARADERFDVDELSKLLSVISMQEAVKVCEGKLDAVFHAEFQREVSLISALPRFHLETGLQGAKYRNGVNIDVLRELYRSGNWTDDTVRPFLHTDLNASFLFGRLHPGLQHGAKKDITAVKSIYNSTARCALYQHPFRQFGLRAQDAFPTNWPRTQQQIRADPSFNIKSNTDAALLFGDIKRHTPPPRYVLEMAKKFISGNLKSGQDNAQYVAVHWRYDTEDFLQYLCVDHAQDRRSSMCSNVRRAMNHTALARAVAKLAADKGVESVYVASPPTMGKFMSRMTKEFRSFIDAAGLNIEIFTSETLKEFIFNSKMECRQQPEEIINDAISQIESVLCSDSAVFLWSVQSTWSSEARFRRKFIARKGDRMDQNIVHLVLQEVEGGKGHRKARKAHPT